jgi:initiation factor 1A
MPKNIKGGNKTKSLKNCSGQKKDRDIAVPEKQDDSHIAIITKVNGDGRFICQIVNQTGKQQDEYITHLSRGVRNKYGRGIIISAGTYVLISIREFQKDKTDIIFVYKDSEINYLINNNYMIIDKSINPNNDIQFVEYTEEEGKDGINEDELMEL